MEFYPSISEKLLENALDFANQHANINGGDKEIVFHSRKSLLFSKNHAWMKKTDDGLFDMTMGCYDGAGVCELI